MSARNIIAIAREMVGQYGSEAASVMERRAQENMTAGDGEAAAFWAQVARAVRALEGRPVQDSGQAQ